MMLKKYMLLIVLVLSIISFTGFITAQSNTNNQEIDVFYFWGQGCPHCATVDDSGVLDDASKIDGVNLSKLEVYNSQENRDILSEKVNKIDGLSMSSIGVPLLIIECNDEVSYYSGDSPIIYNLIPSINDCKDSNNIDEVDSNISNTDSNVTSDINTENNNDGKRNITIGAIVGASLIDSVNPCAFGVLLFLIATLLSVGSRKKMLTYGLIFIISIFLVYFFAGLGISALIGQYMSVINTILIVVGVLLAIGALIEIKDYFWYGRGISLKIPTSARPMLEKLSKKGTLPAIILLGILVALVELPCTGGIYLGILSIMHVNSTLGISYLLLYNLIFVLPLIVMVFLAYYRIGTDTLTYWLDTKKRWMRLFAGIIMLLMALYLLNFVFGWL